MIPHAEEFRVNVGTDYNRWEGLAVFIAARLQGQLRLAEPVDMVLSEPLEEGVAYTQPTLRIPALRQRLHGCVLGVGRVWWMSRTATCISRCP